MNTTSFDTLSAAQDLEAAGIERRQAEAIAEGMRRAAGADHDALATKADIADLKPTCSRWRSESRSRCDRERNG